MPSEEPVNLALSDAAARQLANATKTTAQLDIIIPAVANQAAAVGAGRSGHLPAEPGQGPGDRGDLLSLPATSLSFRRPMSNSRRHRESISSARYPP